jgi:hypothetical protein
MKLVQININLYFIVLSTCFGSYWAILSRSLTLPYSRINRGVLKLWQLYQEFIYNQLVFLNFTTQIPYSHQCFSALSTSYQSITVYMTFLNFKHLITNNICSSDLTLNFVFNAWFYVYGLCDLRITDIFSCISWSYSYCLCYLKLAI